MGAVAGWIAPGEPLEARAKGGVGLGHYFRNVFFQKASELVYRKLQ